MSYGEEGPPPEHEGRQEVPKASQKDFEQLRKIGDLPIVGYEWNAIWWARLHSMEALDSSKVTDVQKKALLKIANLDPDWRVRREADLAAKGGETGSMREGRERNILQSLGDKVSLKYEWDSIWYHRLNAIEKLQHPLSKRQKEELNQVALSDPDWRIREEAGKILDGKPSASMIEKADRRTLETKIGNHPSLNYYWSKIWYERLRAIESLDPGNLTKTDKLGLRKIQDFDPDLRIRKAAENLLQGRDAEHP